MSENIGKLLLRLLLGGMMLFHGIDKVFNGVTNIKGLIQGQGLPDFLAYGVYVGEVLAPILLILGWKSRIWAGLIVVNMAVALFLTQLGNFMKLGTHGAWAIEIPMFYFILALSIVFIGSGTYAMKRD